MTQNKFEKCLGELKQYDSHTEFQASSYYRFISELLKAIHSEIPKERYNTQKVAAPTNIREEIFKGNNYKRAVMYLLTNGCEWALKDGHGCTMCGHLAKQLRSDEEIAADDYLHQFQDEFEKIDFKEHPLLNLYNNGSFFNDRELAPIVRTEILQKINNNRDIKMLVLETRPEFVTPENIREVKQLVPDKHVDIAIGLEMMDDHYRTVCINKGFTLKQYRRAAEIILEHLNLRTYVLLKPPFLTERESIEQAAATIEYAFEAGSSTVSLEACTVQDYTLVHFLYQRGLYRPPWLWSILETVKRVRNAKKLIIGLFQFYPSPSLTPFNCDQCSDNVQKAMTAYNRTLDLTVFDGLNCNCRHRWETTCNQEQLPFIERLEQVIDQLK
jgi:archaeosine synthase beta-subunit